MPTWTPEIWERVCGGFDKEEYLVAAIRRYLLTDTQRLRLFERDVTIEDLLNGRVEGNQDIYAEMFDAWNARLGFRAFGSA